MIKLVVLDIDGVLTDGKVYISEGGIGQKTLSFKDMDAITDLKSNGMKIGIITGEKNYFTQYIYDQIHPDFFKDECKEKKAELLNMARKMGIEVSETCYVGDGKYDKEALICSGLGVCPADAIKEIRSIVDVILTTEGGKGCIAELVTVINRYADKGKETKRSLKGLIEEHILVAKLIENNMTLLSSIEESIELIKAAFLQKGQLLLCGNGGSAADAQHIATEFVSRFYKERAALNAEALTVNTSSITAIGNDYSFDNIFARQVEAKGKKGDVLIALSTSGKSQNVIQAVNTAKKMGIRTIAFIGTDLECELAISADIVIAVPSKVTPRIQEMHIMIAHMICEYVEDELYGKEN